MATQSSMSETDDKQASDLPAGSTITCSELAVPSLLDRL